MGGVSVLGLRVGGATWARAFVGRGRGAIDSELETLAADERRGLVQFLRRLDLLDREGGFELFKCGSAYAYLVREHHLCRRHNQLRAVRRYGRAYVEDRIAEARRAREARRLTKPITGEAAQDLPAATRTGAAAA